MTRDVWLERRCCSPRCKKKFYCKGNCRNLGRKNRTYLKGYCMCPTCAKKAMHRISLNLKVKKCPRVFESSLPEKVIFT